MTVPLRDAGRAIDLGDLAAFSEHRFISAEPHRTAQIAVDLATFEFVAFHPLGHQTDHRLFGGTELRRARALDAGVAGGLDHRHLHAEANAEIRHAAEARESRGADLAFGAALAEAAGHE